MIKQSRIAGVALAVFLAASLAVGKPAQLVQRITVNRVALGDHFEHVLKTLGPPISQDGTFYLAYKSRSYGLTVYFEEDKVVAVDGGDSLERNGNVLLTTGS